MTAWLIGTITFILLLFIFWRGRSKEFRQRCEHPKFQFLRNLGVRSQENENAVQPDDSKEPENGQRQS